MHLDEKSYVASESPARGGNPLARCFRSLQEAVSLEKNGKTRWREGGKRKRETARKRAPRREGRIEREPVSRQVRRVSEGVGLYIWVVKEASVTCYERENRFCDSNWSKSVLHRCGWTSCAKLSRALPCLRYETRRRWPRNNYDSWIRRRQCRVWHKIAKRRRSSDASVQKFGIHPVDRRFKIRHLKTTLPGASSSRRTRESHSSTRVVDNVCRCLLPRQKADEFSRIRIFILFRTKAAVTTPYSESFPFVNCRT